MQAKLNANAHIKVMKVQLNCMQEQAVLELRRACKEMEMACNAEYELCNVELTVVWQQDVKIKCN